MDSVKQSKAIHLSILCFAVKSSVPVAQETRTTPALAGRSCFKVQAKPPSCTRREAALLLGPERCLAVPLIATTHGDVGLTPIQFQQVTVSVMLVLLTGFVVESRPWPPRFAPEP